MTRVRQRLSADVRRAQLVDAAIDVVARAGFAATSADAIAAAAQVSKGLLWHYFDDLDALLLAAAEQAFTVQHETVINAVDGAAPVPTLLRQAIHAAARLPASHPRESRAVREIALNLRRSDGSLRLDESAYAELYAGQAALLRRGQQAGDIREGLDPFLLAVTYQGAVDGMIDHIVKTPGIDVEVYAELVADVLLGGMRT